MAQNDQDQWEGWWQCPTPTCKWWNPEASQGCKKCKVRKYFVQTPAAKKAAKDEDGGKKQSKDAALGADSGSALKNLQQLLTEQGRAAAASTVQDHLTGGGTDSGVGSASTQAQSPPTSAAGTTAQSAWGPATAHSSKAPTGQSATALKKELHEKLSQTESALKALPDSPEFQTVRMQIEAERETYKESLRSLRPVGSRLDSAKQSLTTMRSNAEVLRQAK